jgi:hypothetical protein
MKYQVEGKEININDNSIHEYETIVNHFDVHTIEYMIDSSEINMQLSNKEIEQTIEDAIQEEIQVYKDMPRVFEEIKKQ